jgi:hypothetical protein
LNYRIARSILITSGFAFAFAGAFTLWQMAFQGTSPCYTYPVATFTLLPFLAAYQGSCPYNSIPNYYAGDLSIIAIVLGFGLTLIRFKRRTVEVG